jgi:small subunit ribosomal protein S6
MKTYEAVVIFSSEENRLREGREFIKKEFESSGITVTNEEDMGDRLLAYPVRKNDRGHYFLYVLQCSHEPLKTLSKTLKLRSEVLKFLFARRNA